MAIRNAAGEPEEVDDDFAREVYSMPCDTPAAQLYSRKDSYDSYATTLDDVDAYLPLTRLHEFVAEGRIGSLASNFYVVYSQYSQRKTSQVDAPQIAQWCREDDVDVVLLAAV
jgi:D-proline reductase (dithiol) PrdB